MFIAYIKWLEIIFLIIFYNSNVLRFINFAISGLQ